MSKDDVEQAIRLLASDSAALTLDQRLRIAALLARPAEPETSDQQHASAGIPIEAMVLTVEETADVLKVGRTTVYDLIKSGRLDSIMIGRLRRVRYSDVMAFLDNTHVSGAP
ncbi:helix-turn-helix domain-containing protein [Paractinoplanes durhamensis]|uniref:helix-turn-helix domain-containing protein n=1 Tax=Paractinoplanes durhamensis TaxID=113563 RepID=UPI001941D3DA|nr:helix-turn-helix domain-containing protein [Actinoplanes durhamensis]